MTNVVDAPLNLNKQTNVWAILSSVGFLSFLAIPFGLKPSKASGSNVAAMVQAGHVETNGNLFCWKISSALATMPR